MLLGQQQARLGAFQGVIHLICDLRLKVHQALNVDAVGDEANQHGGEYSHVVQHPMSCQAPPVDTTYVLCVDLLRHGQGWFELSRPWCVHCKCVQSTSKMLIFHRPVTHVCALSIMVLPAHCCAGACQLPEEKVFAEYVK